MFGKFKNIFKKKPVDLSAVNRVSENSLANKHYKAFAEEISWFNYDNDPVEFFDSPKPNLPLAFKNEFPVTSKLYERSIHTGVRFQGASLILLTWELRNGSLCGWMCKKSDAILNMIPEHDLLNRHIGGIVESFNGPVNTELNGVEYNVALSLNQKFMFTAEECGPLHKSTIEAYQRRCTENNCEPLDLSPMLSFVQEANGNMYFYNTISKDVWLMAFDHFFNFVKPVEGPPEYTIHSVNGVSSFTDFVELSSSQWLSHIEEY